MEMTALSDFIFEDTRKLFSIETLYRLNALPFSLILMKDVSPIMQRHGTFPPNKQSLLHLVRIHVKTMSLVQFCLLSNENTDGNDYTELIQLIQEFN